jgi:hypothetical protein
LRRSWRRLLGVAGSNAPAYAWTEEQKKFLAALAKDLKAHAGKSAVIPGLYQDAVGGRAGTGHQQCVGQCGQDGACSAGAFDSAAQRSDCRFEGAGCGFERGQGGLAGDSECQSDLHGARGPEFAAAFDKAKTVAHLGSHVDETGQIAHWHIPAAHLSGVVVGCAAYDGTVSIVQPLIDPLYGGKTAHDVLQTLLDEPMLSAYEAVRETWKPVIKGDFEKGWRKALHAGWIDGTAYDMTAKAGTGGVHKGSRADIEGFAGDHLPARSECV